MRGAGEYTNKLRAIEDRRELTYVWNFQNKGETALTEVTPGTPQELEGPSCLCSGGQ